MSVRELLGFNRGVYADYVRAGTDSGAPVVDGVAPNRAVGSHSGHGGGHAFFTTVSYLGEMNPDSWALHFSTDRPRDFVVSLYGRSLNRLPDAGGYSFQRSVLSTCNTPTARMVVGNFYLSQEFRSLWPMSSRFSTVMRVESLYRGALARKSDPAGLSYYVDFLMSHPAGSQREAAWNTVNSLVTSSAEFNTRVWNGNDHDIPVCP